MLKETTFLFFLLLVVGCATKPQTRPQVFNRPNTQAHPKMPLVKPQPKVPRKASRRFGQSSRESNPLLSQKVSIKLNSTSLPKVLEKLSQDFHFQLIMAEEQIGDLQLSAKLNRLSLESLFSHLETLFPISVEVKGDLVQVRRVEGERLALLAYSLPGGFVQSQLPQNYDSLRQLSFISNAQKSSEGSAVEIGELISDTKPEAGSQGSHLDSFLEHLPKLVPWSDSCKAYLDYRSNVLFVKAPNESLDQIEMCLAMLTQSPFQVRIEARFVEMTQQSARELGLELNLSNHSSLHRNDLGQAVAAVGGNSGTGLGIGPFTATSGLNLAVLGILSEPSFESRLRALETSGEGEVLSAPSITSLNNSRATIAVTRNLPFIEDYKPVFESALVASDGLSSRESSVALVAQINDSNFTGIVLNVTPSIGSDSDQISLRIQPVIRDQVAALAIPAGALVEGVDTPAIERPIIETRYLDTQLQMASGSTVVMGGLSRSVEKTEVRRVPFLGAIPLLGRLFSYEEKILDKRELVIFVKAEILPVDLES